MTVGGTYNNGNNSITYTVRVKYGSTTLWGDGAATSSVNVVGAWFLDFTLYNAGATNSQKLVGHASFNASNTATSTTFGSGSFETAGLATPVYGTSAIDSTTAQTFAVTLQMSSAKSAATFSKQVGVTEFLQ